MQQRLRRRLLLSLAQDGSRHARRRHLLPSDPERLDERQMRLGTDEPLFRLIYSLKQVRIIEPHGEGTVAGGLLRVLERQRPFELTPGSVGVDLNGRPVLRYRI